MRPLAPPPDAHGYEIYSVITSKYDVLIYRKILNDVTFISLLN